MKVAKEDKTKDNVKYLSVVMIAFTPLLANAQAFGSAAYCAQLADIGSNAYGTKMAGHSMGAVIKKIDFILADDPQKKQAANGVVIAIYGDGSLKSAKQAYDTVYTACKR